jgi:predicted transcriptional regulator
VQGYALGQRLNFQPTQKIAHLSRREREVMDLVFAQGEATLSQILEGMDSPPTRPALLSILTILEGKDQLKHRQEGR